MCTYGALPGGLSPDAYVEKRLRPLDAEHYSAAGLQLYRKGSDGIELLLPRERPWNSFTQAYDPTAWNVFGGKRVPRQERAVETTGVRCFLECVGEVEGAPNHEVLYGRMPSSFVMWYPAGKFALLVIEVTDGSLEDFPERFARTKGQGGPAEEYRILPQGIKKYVKQIDEVSWVKAAELVPEPKSEVSDLLGNILQVPAFREFLNGSLDPEKAWPEGSYDPAPVIRQENGKDWKGKGKGGGKGQRWKGMKGFVAPLGPLTPMSPMGYGKGVPMTPMSPIPMTPMSPMPMTPMSPMQPMQQMQPIQQMYTGKGAPMGPPMVQTFSSYEPSSEEMQRQMYGEQLYLLVQPLAPSPFLAQKITGMLLELPHNELVLNLTNSEELHRRVREALEVLREDGLA